MKKYIKVVVLFVVTVLLTLELPYRSYSIVEIILPPIYMRSNTAALHLSGLLIIFFIVLIYKEIKRINPKSKKFYVLVIILFFNFPVNDILTEITGSIYNLNENVRTVRVTDSWMRLSEESDQIIMNLHLHLKAYDKSIEPFDCYIEMPLELQDVYGTESILVEDHINVLHESETQFKYRFELKPVNGKNNMDINEIKKSFRSYQIVFQSDDEKSKWYLRKY